MLLRTSWFQMETGDKHAPTLRVYFRNFIRIFWYFQSTFPIKFPLFSQKHHLIDRIRMHSLRHESAMRLPHVCYVIRARDGWHDRKRCFWSTCAPALPSQFWNALDQSAHCTSPSHSAESSRARHLHNNGLFHHIPDASCQKYYYIWIESFAIGSFFILKFRLTL